MSWKVLQVCCRPKQFQTQYCSKLQIESKALLPYNVWDESRGYKGYRKYAAYKHYGKQYSVSRTRLLGKLWRTWLQVGIYPLFISLRFTAWLHLLFRRIKPDFYPSLNRNWWQMVFKWLSSVRNATLIHSRTPDLQRKSCNLLLCAVAQILGYLAHSQPLRHATKSKYTWTMATKLKPSQQHTQLSRKLNWGKISNGL